jgi:hypothetical protein
MKRATVHIGTDRFGQSAAGLVYGGLYIQLDEQNFPDLGWTDFVVVVLAWWCRALTRVLEGEGSPIEVRFMEGPYLAVIGPASGETLRLALVEAGKSRRIFCEGEVLSDPLVKSVLASAELTIVECRKRDWWSKDADELVDALATLKRKDVRLMN